jgi:hypothetical protein
MPQAAFGRPSAALTAALARIEREFGISQAHARFKNRVRRWLRLGPSDFQVYCRFRDLAFDLEDADLARALVRLNSRAWLERLARRADARRRGRAHAGNFPLHGALGEAQLILRYLRHTRRAMLYPLIRQSLLLPFAQRPATGANDDLPSPVAAAPDFFASIAGLAIDASEKP